MALTTKCPGCGSTTLTFLRSGVPVDTTDGTVELDDFTCSDMESCSITTLGDVPDYPAAAGTYLLQYDQAAGTTSWVASSSLAGGLPAAFSSEVTWADGPGNAGNTAATYAVGGETTMVQISGDPDGDKTIWSVQQDVSSVWQWRSLNA